jgi:uncharacterized protein (DUF2147 family)
MRPTSARLALLLGILGPLAVGGTATGEAAGNHQSPAGVWLTASGNLEVGVEPCGSAFCGKVVRVAANRAMDQAGDNASVNSVIGLTILKDFTPSGDDEWDGEIYNRENGKTYSCRIELAADDTLKVRPYKFLPLFGQTQIWHRVSEKAEP